MVKHILITLTLLTQLNLFGQTLIEDISAFLEVEVAFGLVNYGSIRENPAELNRIVSAIESATVQDSSQTFQTAFYINAYNILVIKQVVDNYPIESPKDIDGFFNTTRFIVAGDSLTLDQIEFDKLLNPTQDPRIHFAIACAARSCPYLYDRAFRPNTLDSILDVRTERIIERSSYVYVDYKKQEINLNMIFSWYTDQFLWIEDNLIDYINRYKVTEVPEDFKISFFDYDWSLNDNK